MDQSDEPTDIAKIHSHYLFEGTFSITKIELFKNAAKALLIIRSVFCSVAISQAVFTLRGL